MSDANYIGLEKDRHATLLGRYAEFVERLSDVNKEPVKVYDPLPQRALNELDLIRQVSGTLQEKKNEEMRRIAQAAASQQETAQEPAKKEAEETAATDEAVKED